MNKLILICIVILYMVLPGVSRAGSLTDNGDGTVTDSGTLLMWQQGESSALTWEAALTYCEGLVLPVSGYDDWRLPNHKELMSLVDDTRYNPSINTTLFANAASSYYWSSTSHATTASYAWHVDFYHGASGVNDKGGGTFQTRCVRACISGSACTRQLRKTGIVWTAGSSSRLFQDINGAFYKVRKNRREIS
jgi:hypothetical protein